jgi:hypothetical protein
MTMTESVINESKLRGNPAPGAYNTQKLFGRYKKLKHPICEKE